MLDDASIVFLFWSCDGDDDAAGDAADGADNAADEAADEDDNVGDGPEGVDDDDDNPGIRA